MSDHYMMVSKLRLKQESKLLITKVTLSFLICMNKALEELSDRATVEALDARVAVEQLNDRDAVKQLNKRGLLWESLMRRIKKDV